MFDSFLDLLSPGLEGVVTFICAMCFLFSPLIDLEKILLSAIIQIRGKFHDKKRLYARLQRTDIKGMPRGRECCCCRQTA